MCACHVRTIDEFWCGRCGEGDVWRRAPGGEERITRLVSGVCVNIPLGTAFQYRCAGDADFVFTCTAMPPWPGSAGPKRQRKWWRYSSRVGAPKLATST